MYIMKSFGKCYMAEIRGVTRTQIQNDTPERIWALQLNPGSVNLLGVHSLASNLSCFKSKVGNSYT